MINDTFNINVKKPVKKELSLNMVLNNETIGQSAEAAFCQIANIICNINEKRLCKTIVDKICVQLINSDILNKLPSRIISSCGYTNGSIDFKLENGETMSLKTLKYKNGKICPQKVGQPTLNSWDKIWKKPYQGKLDKNPERWIFIKENIHDYLNKMIAGIFCCDHLIVINDCMTLPSITLYSNELINNKLNYFTNQHIIYSKEIYEEKWNEKKQKYSEMSSTIKTSINNKIICIGEFQFHKTSRLQLKFRFYDTFIQLLF